MEERRNLPLWDEMNTELWEKQLRGIKTDTIHSTGWHELCEWYSITSAHGKEPSWELINNKVNKIHKDKYMEQS